MKSRVLVFSGLVAGSPAGGPRPMGFPPRFGFNPNMPPPGFRMPPPGFPPHMRPMRMPTMPPPSEDKAEDAPNKELPPREMIWPPDSNEKDEDDMDEEEQDAEKEDLNKSEGDEPPPGFMPPNDQPPFGMMGPVPPGGFPPGPPHAWPMGLGMRPPGPRPMRFPAGMPDMFNGPRGPMMGGPMPPFMGMGPGFPRFPPGMGPGPRPGPVSLLDLDIKPPPKFSEENKEKDDMENAEEEENEGEEEEPNEDGEVQEEEESEEPGSSYPFGAWQSVPAASKQSNYDNNETEEGNDDGEDRDRHRSWDEEGSRNRRDYDRRDRDRDRDRGDRSHRDRGDRDRGGWDRGDRDRDRNRDRDRDWGRDRDRDRDWRRRDDRRDRDRDRGRDRDGHRRQRKSRWGDPIENTDDSQPPVLEREGFPEITREDNFDHVKEPDLTQEYGSDDRPSNVNDSEFNPYDGDSNQQFIENDNNNEGFMPHTDGDHYEGNMNGENTSENQHDAEPPNLEQETTNLETTMSTNGPDSVKHMPAVISNKLDVIPDLGIGNTDGAQENSEKTEPNDREYEEGELDS